MLLAFHLAGNSTTAGKVAALETENKQAPDGAVLFFFFSLSPGVNMMMTMFNKMLTVFVIKTSGEKKKRMKEKN